MMLHMMFTLLVQKSRFENNIAIRRGGAVLAGYIHGGRNSILIPNKILFDSCDFTGNRAGVGGGVYLYSAPIYVQTKCYAAQQI